MVLVTREVNAVLIGFCVVCAYEVWSWRRCRACRRRSLRPPCGRRVGMTATVARVSRTHTRSRIHVTSTSTDMWNIQHVSTCTHNTPIHTHTKPNLVELHRTLSLRRGRGESSYSALRSIASCANSTNRPPLMSEMSYERRLEQDIVCPRNIHRHRHHIHTLTYTYTQTHPHRQRPAQKPRRRARTCNPPTW